MSKGLEALGIVKAAMLSSGNCLLNSLWDYTDVIEKELKVFEIFKEIEKKIGIDLITLLRVQTDGAYFKGKDRKWIPSTDYNEKCFKLMETEIYRFYFKDYGKTWAFTREELQ